MLRDRIRAFVDDDPAALEGRLEAAVQRSDFADAARVRDRLKKQQVYPSGFPPRMMFLNFFRIVWHKKVKTCEN